MLPIDTHSTPSSSTLKHSAFRQLGQQLKLVRDKAPDPTNRQWCPFQPHPRQKTFLDLTCREAFYGGAAGGGKSTALLMAALQYVDIEGYSALLLRRKLTDQKRAGALVMKAHEWLDGTAARWHAGSHMWTFPSGATLQFGYLDTESDLESYHSAEYQFIGFDELTHFHEHWYTYMFARCRRQAGVPIPVRVRSGSNPGSHGHEWVKKRFITNRKEGVEFVPALVTDNPTLDADDYLLSLEELDPIRRDQLAAGDWDAETDSVLVYDTIVSVQTPASDIEFGGLACAEMVDPLRPKARLPEYFVGYDIGRTQDRTVIVMLELIHDVFWTRKLIVLHKVKFEEQLQIISDVVATPGVVKCYGDMGGIGMHLFERLESVFRSKVVGVIMSETRQGELANLLRITFNQAGIRIPDDARLRDDLQMVKASELDERGAVTKVKTNRNATGHADRFWAYALARAAAPVKRPTKAVAKPIGYRASRKR